MSRQRPRRETKNEERLPCRPRLDSSSARRSIRGSRGGLRRWHVVRWMTWCEVASRERAKACTRVYDGVRAHSDQWAMNELGEGGRGRPETGQMSVVDVAEMKGAIGGRRQNSRHSRAPCVRRVVLPLLQPAMKPPAVSLRSASPPASLDPALRNNLTTWHCHRSAMCSANHMAWL